MTITDHAQGVTQDPPEAITQPERVPVELVKLVTAVPIEQWNELMDFVQLARPVIEELNDNLPALLALTEVAKEVSKGGIAGLFGLLKGA